MTAELLAAGAKAAAMKPFVVSLVCALLVAIGLPDGAQAQIMPAPTRVGVPLPPPIELQPDLLAGLPRRTVTVDEAHGGSATYSGVDLGALLARSGAPHGPALHGAAAAIYVVVRAADGYHTVFALAELDPAVTDKVVLLADQRNGAALGSDLGPFRVVVPDEKRQVRWIRNVVSVDIEEAP